MGCPAGSRAGRRFRGERQDDATTAATMTAGVARVETNTMGVPGREPRRSTIPRRATRQRDDDSNDDGGGGANGNDDNEASLATTMATTTAVAA